MPFPIVRPNAIPSYHRPGPKLGSNVGGMAGFVGNTEAPRAISRSSSSTVPESSQMMHPNVAASAYEMNWMNLGADNYDEMPGPSSGYGSFPNQYGNEYGGGGAISAGFNESQSSLLPDSFGYDARNQSTFQPIRLATAQKRGKLSKLLYFGARCNESNDVIDTVYTDKEGKLFVAFGCEFEFDHNGGFLTISISFPHHAAGHQYSTDDEEFEEVGTSDNEGVSVTLEQSNTTSSMMPPQSEDDSQQAAEAMVQLSSAQYYNSAQDESMEIDPNYDPSDFLGMSSRQQTGDSGRNDAGIQQSSEASYSVDQNAPSSEYSQEAGRQEANDQQQQHQQFQYQPDPTGQSMDNPSQPPAALPTLQTLHSDLAISDSDDEKTNLQMDEVRDDNDDNDEGGDLWF